MCQHRHKGSRHLPATDATVSPSRTRGYGTQLLALPPTEKPEAAALIATIISALGRRAPLQRAARLLLLMSLVPEQGAETEPGARGGRLLAWLEKINKQPQTGSRFSPYFH